MLNEHLPYRSRWGGDRICPNVPDEGTSKAAELDCESEGQQIRFASPEGRIRADSRLVFLRYPHKYGTRNRSTSHKYVSSLVERTPRKSHVKTAISPRLMKLIADSF